MWLEVRVFSRVFVVGRLVESFSSFYFWFFRVFRLVVFFRWVRLVLIIAGFFFYMGLWF